MSLLRECIREILSERTKFKTSGDYNYFRVDLPGIGYAEGGSNLRFRECQSDVDTLMKTPEYKEAEAKFNADPKNVFGDGSRQKFRPKFYDVTNAWIKNPDNRGKGHGKEIYEAFIAQAVYHARNSGGVFIGAHKCVMGSGTSEDAQRVWKSLARDYTASGMVIFIGT